MSDGNHTPMRPNEATDHALDALEAAHQILKVSRLRPVPSYGAQAIASVAREVTQWALMYIEQAIDTREAEMKRLEVFNRRLDSPPVPSEATPGTETPNGPKDATDGD